MSKPQMRDNQGSSAMRNATLSRRDMLWAVGALTVGAAFAEPPAKAWIVQLRASGPPPSPNLGVVMGPEFAQLSANLGRNLMEGRLGILTAVFEAVSINT